MMKISKDYEEFFELLNKHEVNYVVVGGYAYAIHVEPRFTKDLDIFIKRDRANVLNLLKTLHEFGFGSLELSEHDLLEPNQIIQLGYPPLRIDILTSLSGVEFEEAWPNRVTGNYGSQQVFFIGREELRKNKKATGRKSDLEDLEKL